MQTKSLILSLTQSFFHLIITQFNLKIKCLWSYNGAELKWLIFIPQNEQFISIVVLKHLNKTLLLNVNINICWMWQEFCDFKLLFLYFPRWLYTYCCTSHKLYSNPSFPFSTNLLMEHYFPLLPPILIFVFLNVFAMNLLSPEIEQNLTIMLSLLFL